MRGAAVDSNKNQARVPVRNLVYGFCRQRHFLIEVRRKSNDVSNRRKQRSKLVQTPLPYQIQDRVKMIMSAARSTISDRPILMRLRKSACFDLHQLSAQFSTLFLIGGAWYRVGDHCNWRCMLRLKTFQCFSMTSTPSSWVLLARAAFAMTAAESTAHVRYLEPS